VSFLLDTHVVVWMIGSGPRAAGGVLERLLDPEATLFVSAVSAMEVATKVRLGKFPEAADLAANWARTIDEFGADRLSIEEDHAVRAGSLEWPHRDPFDRILVAQASAEGLTLVTADAALLHPPGVKVLRWA
jgi:PIN domain nuclease of toxin-antitoxin system